MRLLIILLLAAGLFLAPFVALRKTWALRLWQRIKLLVVAYVIVMIFSAIFWLATRWDSIYG